MINSFLWTVKLVTLAGQLAIASALIAACQGEGTPTDSPKSATSAPVVATPFSIDIPTLTPFDIPTTTRQPVATDHPSTPTPTISQITDLPGNVCGPFWIPYKGDYHQHFLHWTKDGLQLVFDASEAIWIVDEAGTEVRKIVDPDPARGAANKFESVYGFYADVSPDGSRIAYTTCEYPMSDPPRYALESTDPREGLGYEIALIDIDGASKERLTNNEFLEHYPVWSPDGSRIAYVFSNSKFGRYDHRSSYLYFRSTDDAGSANFARLGQASSNVALHPPVWSPDGQQIAFLVYESGIGQLTRILYTIQTDGTEFTKIGEATTQPTWSPDGSQLAYAGPAGADGEAFAIYAVKPDGSDRRIIWSDEYGRTSHGIHQVSWSPTGSELLFVSNGVYTIGSSGGDPRQISTAIQDRYPLSRHYSAATIAAWSPDGSRIAVYHPDRELIIMARDGTGAKMQVEVSNDGTANIP